MKTGYFRMLFTLLAVLLLGSAAKAQTIHYVTPTGANPTTGNKWEVSGNVKSLTAALEDAVAGDQIWVLGFEQSTLSANQLYVAPEGGFTVKSGVKLYGGFRGTERTIDERPTLGKAPYFTYRSVLSGDINCDDTVDEINYVYPTNTTRSDNATHVLSLNMEPTEISGNINTYPTVVNGFTVIGGNAIGGNGGGIYVYGDNTGGGAYQIEKCFLLNNYAELGGGAIYVSAHVKATSTESRIVDCVVYNNLAGVRSGAENLGGGIRIDGVGTIVNSSIFNNEGGGVRLSSNAKAVNLTIARNTVMGIDGGEVYNSVIWGNSKVQNPASADIFHNCASDNATIAEGDKCFAISSESNGANGPLFEAPSVFTSFDRDFDWRETAYPTWSWGILEGSALIDKGNDVVYTGLPSTDLAGETRKKGTIDIGAYEFQHLDAGRIRYVKVGGTGDGSSWDNASGDLQKMIDELATVNAPGEVWVAKGEYRPITQIIEGVQYAASFRMRDGIDVYGGFAGGETSKAERKKGSMPWIYTNETILLGADYEDGSATWGNDQWNVISSSRHVVWFAPMSGEDNFKSVTILDGVTIKGGAANGGEGLADFATDKGGGVYMGLNAILQNCIVTENTAKGDGGGVYANGDGADASSANAKGGRVVGCLVYNNSSVEDGGGVFVKNAGLVLRSMITNNSATNGAGVYLDKNAENHPEYLILSTSVVSNNTATGNGAVYCNESGVLLQNTIVNNDCPSTVDASNPNSSQTGGLYINKYAYVINSILWNNLINGLNIPMYALGATADKVRFYNNAISGSSNAVWNNIYQTSTLKLSDENSKEKALSPDFKPGYPAEKPNDEPEKVLSGVQSSWVPTYYWEPQQGSNLRAGGLTIGTFPDNVLVAPELDIAGTAFAQKPAVGAHAVDANGIEGTEIEGY
jgi:predicted outer membrane repeat protein